MRNIIRFYLKIFLSYPKINGMRLLLKILLGILLLLLLSPSSYSYDPYKTKDSDILKFKTLGKVEKSSYHQTNLDHIEDEFPSYLIKISYRNVYLSKNKVLKRFMYNQQPWKAKPLTMTLFEPMDLSYVAKKIGKPSKKKKLEKILKKNKNTLIQRREKGGYILTLKKVIVPYITNEFISQLSTKKSLVPWLMVDKINDQDLHLIVDHFSTHWKADEIRLIIEDFKERKIKSIRMDRVFFPSFAKKRIFKFEKVLGPNCFHSSIAFNNPNVASYPWININKENGHYITMINYDELWSTLKRFYIPINPQETLVKFGDIIIFYDKTISPDGTFYKSYKHATTYLFDRLVFNKDSKTPKTPYLILNLDQVMKNWKNRYNHLGYRIYRIKNMRVQPQTYSLLDIF